MAPLIFVSDMGTAPQIPKGFFASDHERSAEHPARMMIDKEYSSVPAVITMSRQALDRLLLSPRHDFDEAIGLLPAIYLDEKTGRFIERKRELSHTQDMRSIGIRQSSFDARCLHALMEALDDLPVVTIFWTAISQASSFNAVSFRNAKT